MAKTAPGQELGFGVTIIDAKTDTGGGDSGDSGDNDDGDDPESHIISSSRIRRLLGVGDVAASAHLLGYHWLVSGPVIKGAQLGRTL
ncbi:MAG: hypothetical protein MJH08_08950, partial [Hyphomicrobiales bacterium]|nr:hypothetical protein [Hyphomicrobiales bacterium]